MTLMSTFHTFSFRRYLTRDLMRVALAAWVLLTAWGGAQAQFRPSVTILKQHVLTRVNADGTSTDEMELVRRVETPRGVSAIAETQLNFTETLSSVEVLEAWTITPEGQRLDVKPDQIRTLSDKNGGEREFGDDKVKVIIFPAVTPGAVVGYRAHYKHHKAIFEGHHWSSFVFSPHLRYEDIKVRLEWPATMKLHLGIQDLRGIKNWAKVQGAAAAPNAQTPAGWLAHEFTYRHDQVVRPENGRVNLEDFAPQIMASTFSTYADVARAYVRTAAPQAQLTPALVDLAKSITAGLSEERSKVNALYQWVSQNIRYVSVAIGNGGWVPHPAAQVLEHRYGDCKDHVVLLQALLNAVGIQSTGALVNSGKTYRLPEVASSDPFNHIITYVPSLKMFMDSTAELAPMGVLPFEVMGKPTVLVATGEVLKTPATHSDTERAISKTVLKMRPDGSIEGRNLTTRHGQQELASRANRLKEKDREQTYVINEWLERFGETGTGEMTFPDPKDLNERWEIKSEFVLDPLANVPGPSAMTIPVGLAPGELRSLVTERPLDNRNFEAICGSAYTLEETEMQFPKSVKIERVPRAVAFHEPGLRYESHYVLKGKTLQVKREFWLQRERAVCDAKEDAQWAKFLPVLQRDLRAQVFFK